MSTFDIRNSESNQINKVVFADPVEYTNRAYRITKLHSVDVISIDAHDYDKVYVTLHSAEDARNLIKALEYAIANGWFVS